MNRPARALAAAAALALIAAGCGSKPKNDSSNNADNGSSSSAAPSDSASASGSITPTSASSAGSVAPGGKAFKVCLVLDTGGVNDKSFNESAYTGAQKAAKKNPDIKVSYLQSKSDADYTPNLTNSAKKGCDEVVATGGLLGKATAAAAKQFPKTHFALVDDSVTAPVVAPNLYSISFKSEQGSYLAGYVAASISKSGIVGTWGGINVGPQVTAYMDGYQQGAEYYGRQKGKDVTVIGWNGKKGSFLGPPNGFGDPGAGKSLTNTQVQQGADVIFPVAGGSGAGALTAAEAAGGKLSVIWVDFPGCTNYPKDCKYIPTSSLKNISGEVEQYALTGASGKVSTGHFVGTLANKGVGIDGFHDFDGKISAATKKEVTDIATKIGNGSIQVKVNG